MVAHVARVSDWDQQISPSQVADLPLTTSLLAQQAPRWEPDTRERTPHGKPGASLILHVTKKSMKGFVAQEIADSVGANSKTGAH
jgi:hypothetical protein